MSRVPDEPQSWPTESDPDAVLGDLRKQIESARQRLGQQWNQMRAANDAAPDREPGAGETQP